VGTFLRWTPPADGDEDDDDDDDDVAESDSEPDAPQETRLPASPPDSPAGPGGNGVIGSNTVSDNMTHSG
jgi:hypothetical protein